MGVILQIENLTKSFGDRTLFQDISFGMDEGDKIGVIAKNGTGKSTLMNILIGKEGVDGGKVTFRNDLKIGYLEQTPLFDPELSVIEACLNTDSEICNLINKYDLALGNNDKEIAELIHKMDATDAWTYKDKLVQVLSQLKIDDYNQKIKELSGGQLKRVALAKIIMDDPELFILDEPTNHLDIDMIEWLENYLTRSKVSILMVTHDRYFLDKICNKIIEIDQCGIFTYNGNYDYYLEKRAERIESQNSELTKAKNLYRTELDWMRRQPQARATKAKYRIDAFAGLENKVKNQSIDNSLKLDIKSSYIGTKIFEAHHIYKKFGDKIILEDFNYVFARYDKVGIVGDNGVGKSTFIKLLLGEVKADSGEFEIGETVNFGYYSQDGISFDENKKVIDAVKEIAEVIHFDEKNSYTASQFLKLFLFSPSDQQKLIEKLSGGEKRRLYLATVLMKKPNFLILDEPTNDLDIITLEILEDYLEKFKGCVLIVSHDRFFMDKTVNHLFVFDGDGKIKDFPGNYTEYRDWKDEQREFEKQNSEDDKSKAIKNNGRRSEKITNKLTFKERKELESLSTELDNLNTEKKELEDYFSSGESALLEEKSKRYSEVKDLIDEKEFRWLELSEKE